MSAAQYFTPSTADPIHLSDSAVRLPASTVTTPPGPYRIVEICRCYLAMKAVIIRPRPITECFLGLFFICRKNYPVESFRLASFQVHAEISDNITRREPVKLGLIV